MLDLCCKYLKKVYPVFLYFIKDLSIRNNIIVYYEKRYKIKIASFPHHDLAKIYKAQAYCFNNQSISIVSQFEMDNFLRDKFNCEWIAYGYKKSDSLSRRGILNMTEKGIDKKNKKIYPLMDWNNQDSMKYCKVSKLPLPPDYDFGFRDINFFKGKSLLFLKNNFPDDFKRVVNQFPFIEVSLYQ